MLIIRILEFSLVILTLSLHDAVSEHTNMFRKDYTFIENMKSYYKFYTLPRTWTEAKAICGMEGATLFYPKDEDEALKVVEFWNSTKPQNSIFIGISDNLSKGVYETIDGLTIDEVYNRWRRGEPNDVDGMEDCVVMDRANSLLNDDRCDRRLPFICKKPENTVSYDLVCETPYSGYEYDASTSRCYKLHQVKRDWSTAHAVCRAEQSYLAVINSREEYRHLVHFVFNATENVDESLYSREAVHLGFHNLDGEGWKTIQGQPLEESGFTNWSDGQPDGKDAEKCGVMTYEGALHDRLCSLKYFFICEHEIRRTLDFNFNLSDLQSKS